jgi:tetratricopeptide (TPR) repeat protein
MYKRTLIVVLVTAALIIGSEPLGNVHAGIMTKAELLALDLEETTREADQKADGQRGNGFARVIKAPFKAIGRLFGRGKKNGNSLQRLSEKDVKKFETASVVRVVDARIAPEPTPNAPPANQPANTSLSNTDSQKAKAREHLELGRSQLNSGQSDNAIRQLQQAIVLDKTLSEAHNLLGVAFESKGLRDLAFKSFEIALRGDDDNPEHLNNMGYLYYKNGDYNQAAKYLKQAVKLAPDRARYWNNLGLVQIQRHNFDDAYRCFARGGDEFDAHMNVANKLQMLGESKEAIKHLEAARVLRPNVAIVLLRLTNLYNRIGKTEQATETREALAALQALASTPN